MSNMKKFGEVVILLSILSLTAIFLAGCKKTTVVVPPEVRTEACSNITRTTVTIGGTITSDGGAETIGQGFIITPPGANFSAGKNADGTFSTTINYLTPGTTYSIKAFAGNSAGTGYGLEIEFKTSGSPIMGPTVTDLDGNTYHSVVIGTQTWLQENFKGVHYANGDPIPKVTDFDSWFKLTTGAYCWYNNDPQIGAVYGGLYNWYVGIDPRGLITGWHVPTDEEWQDLSDSFGGYIAAGQEIMETGTNHWLQADGGNNASGFTILPNGFIATDFPSNILMYGNLKEQAVFQTTSQFMGYSENVGISREHPFLSIGALWGKENGAGIRLIKNVP
jgi:uncharacterized protein (TIGR02145 family)